MSFSPVMHPSTMRFQGMGEKGWLHVQGSARDARGHTALGMCVCWVVFSDAGGLGLDDVDEPELPRRRRLRRWVSWDVGMPGARPIVCAALSERVSPEVCGVAVMLDFHRGVSRQVEHGREKND